MWILADRSHRSGPHEFLECSRPPTTRNFRPVRPECPDLLKSPRDARGPMFTGPSRVSRLSRVKNGSAAASPIIRANQGRELIEREGLLRVLKYDPHKSPHTEAFGLGFRWAVMAVSL